MFVVQSLGKELSQTLANRNRFPNDQLEETLSQEVEDIRKHLKPEECVAVLVFTFRCLIATNVFLPTVGVMCEVLRTLDMEGKLPFDDITEACYRARYTDIHHILEKVGIDTVPTDT